MSNIEFSSVKITKALHEAVKGVSVFLDKSEQDFIHSVLAFEVGKIIRENFETVHLYGESVKDDVESLKRYYSLRREGEYVKLAMSGTYHHFKNISKAMELVGDELEEDEKEIGKDEDFRLLFRNIGYESSCQGLRDELISDLFDGTIDYEKAELEVKEKQEKYREEKGYLESEIPFGFVPRIYQSIVDPHLFLSQADLALTLAQQIDAGNFTIREVVLFVFTFRQLADKSKKKLENFLGKERMDRIKKLINLRVKDYLMDEIDGVLDMLETVDVKGEDELTEEENEEDE